MKKFFIVILCAVVALVGFQFVKEVLLSPPTTTIRMLEGVTSVYYVYGPGDMEYIGSYRAGETVEVLPRNRGAFAMFNMMQYMVPKAVALFKTNIAKFSSKPSGLIVYPFTEYEFDQQCISKMRTSWMPDLRVALHKDGYTATGTLNLFGLKVPFSSTGIVGIDPTQHATMYVKFDDITIAGFHLPRYMLDRLEDDSNKMMERGLFQIEILDMQYRDGRIDITYYKHSASIEGLEDREAAYFYKPTPEKLKEAVLSFFTGQLFDKIKKFFTF
jgi:hypothetical protein